MEYDVIKLIEFLENWANPSFQEEWDNSGWQILFDEEKTASIVVALDIDDRVIDFAIEKNSKLIITHHPMFFRGIKNINFSSYFGENILKLIENKISVYSSHTSLDIAINGVNDCLAEFLELDNCVGLSEMENGCYIGKIGTNNKFNSLAEIKNKFEDELKIDNIKLYGKYPSKLDIIAICGGSGSDFISDAVKHNANLYITGDIKYHDGQYAYENNIAVMDIGHYGSEKLIIEKLSYEYKNKFEIDVYSLTSSNFELELDRV
ncbi:MULTISPECIES: Nif3-like dinuclear metal center hexameric protein [Peptoniphilus]|uniref:Nif3-like dinuclear metal center hexameric protein n=1 Tax=Peptoniphilus TaxID=162289 RepID=UPI0001DA9BC1|nr:MULTISPECIES: Nif3-like dinuclear metal center hexameric protein [Peptoniphilus]EFI42371.1 dinuclear metal center protein, YbgI family [Peptoniphilus sp. oral taxon 386 str. F0131]